MNPRTMHRSALLVFLFLFLFNRYKHALAVSVEPRPISNRHSSAYSSSTNAAHSTQEGHRDEEKYSRMKAAIDGAGVGQCIDKSESSTETDQCRGTYQDYAGTTPAVAPVGENDIADFPIYWSDIIRGFLMYDFRGKAWQTFSAYQSLLRDHAVISKSITATIVALLGDLLAQGAERRGVKQRTSLDWTRMFSVSAEGLFVSGPMLHYGYDMLEALFSASEEDSTVKKYLMIMLQVVLDIIILDTIFTGTLMITTAILEGRARQIPRELYTEYLPSVRAAWISSFMMCPLQFANFAFMPVEFRVLITNFQDVIWNAAVSCSVHKSRI